MSALVYWSAASTPSHSFNSNCHSSSIEPWTPDHICYGLRCIPRSHATHDIDVLHAVLSNLIVETELGPPMILCQASDEWSARQPTKTRELRADTWIDML